MERQLYRWMPVLLLVALGWFGVAAFSPGTGGWLGPLRFHQGVFVLVMFGSIPATILLFLPLRLTLGAPRGRLFWIKHPAQTVEHVTGDPVSTIASQARTRLEQLGFTVQSTEENGAQTKILFNKPKEKKVVRFIDHALAGELLLRRETGRTKVRTTVTFLDTVVLESGEYERMAALGRYVAGSVAELNVAVLPFTMLNGVVIATVNLMLLSVASWRTRLAPHELDITLAAVGLILFGGLPILRNRGENYGLLLGLLGLGAAILPLLAG